MTKMVNSLLVLAVVFVASSLAQNQYCKICDNHTLCIYPNVGPMCQPLTKQGVSAADKKTIVDAHNELRARVANGQEGQGSNGRQPAAANMRKMTWDDELARIAQRWAQQCNYGHDKCRNVQRFQVGQNAALTTSSSSTDPVDWRSKVQAWYSEVNKFDNRNIDSYTFDYPTGHYSQVVWATSKSVGCGYAQYRTAGSKDTYYYYVCNYGPSGNFGKASVYVQGKACSKCPAGVTLCENGLCV